LGLPINFCNYLGMLSLGSILAHFLIPLGDIMIIKQTTKNKQGGYLTSPCLGMALLSASGEITAQDIVEEQAVPVQS
jgi:hypothetical protein